MSFCKSRKSTDVIDTATRKCRFQRGSKSKLSQPSSLPDPPSSSSGNFTSQSSSSDNDYSKSPLRSRSSLSIVGESLPESPHVFGFAEICSATNNFLAKRFSASSTSSSWRCSIRGKDAIVFQRKSRRQIHLQELKRRLSVICRSHHSSVVKLLGASASGNYVYLVYEYVPGANLADCLRNPKNPNFTVLSSWLSRMQIATDLAHGLDYIHHCSGLDSHFVHNHIKSLSVIIMESPLSPKICHFGTSELCGEVKELSGEDDEKETNGNKHDKMQVVGTRGYMAPEIQSKGLVTQKSDVFAFGVLMLELISGEEALKYRFEKAGGGYVKASIIDAARDAVKNITAGGGGVALRRWVDRRLKDSFPVEVAEKMVRLGLECVQENPGNRPHMGRVVGMVSKLYLESKSWSEKIVLPEDFSVSMTPR